MMHRQDLLRYKKQASICAAHAAAYFFGKAHEWPAGNSIRKACEIEALAWLKWGAE